MGTASLFCCLGVDDKNLRILWLRRRDLMILSHDTTVFTTDPRVEVHFYPVSGIWELRISRLGEQDGGEYGCQANTAPRREARILLEVEETQAEIVGPAELFLRPGSKLELHCRVGLGRAGPDDHFRKTAVLHWFQDQRLIDPGAGREKGVITQVTLGSDLQGWLTVAKTSVHHSGNYSCVASYSRPAWLLVHIVADMGAVELRNGVSSRATSITIQQQFSAFLLLLPPALLFTKIINPAILVGALLIQSL